MFSPSFALTGTKRARGVNRDALFLLLEEGIEQEGIFEFLALALANTPDLLQLAFRKRPCIREQAAQQCGLSMVHMADDDDVEMFLGAGSACIERGQHGLHV